MHILDGLEKIYDSLYLPRAHEDIVLIRVRGHAPNKVLSAPSVTDNSNPRRQN